MKILFLSRWFPYPPDNGSKLRIYNLLRQLANQHTLDLISFTSEEISEKRLAPLQPFCRYIETVHYRPFESLHLKAIIGFFSPLPRSVLDTDNTNMHLAIQRKMQETQYDLVIASQVDMAQYARNLPLIKVLDEIELAMLHDRAEAKQNMFKKMRNTLMWQKWTRYIIDTMRNFDGGTVVSEPERQLVGCFLQKSGCITPIQIIPNGVDTSYYREDFGKPMPDTLVFSGALTYSANYNAMDFFLREVFPLIQLKTPNVKLTITGCLDGVPVKRLPTRSGVVLAGYLEDVRPTIARSWVSIVPLQIGGGTRLKILEALALGTPVVSTSKGAEGLELTPNQDILIADNPSDFASAVLRLFADPSIRHSLSQNGRHAVATRYDWKMIGQSLDKFINQISK
jgi:glycosyltransferase involved in cell wall biosynthesis